MDLNVEDYYNVTRMIYLKYGKSLIPMELDESQANHVIQVGASVMLARDDKRYGGSFVQAIIGNDLQGAINRADATIRHCLLFMVYLKSQVRVEQEIQNMESVDFEKIDS